MKQSNNNTIHFVELLTKLSEFILLAIIGGYVFEIHVWIVSHNIVMTNIYIIFLYIIFLYIFVLQAPQEMDST